MIHDLSNLNSDYHSTILNVFKVSVVNECLASLKSNATGCDDLDYLLLKALSPRLLSYFTHLFNTVLCMSSFPDEWKQLIGILPFLSKVMKAR